MRPDVGGGVRYPDVKRRPGRCADQSTGSVRTQSRCTTSKGACCGSRRRSTTSRVQDVPHARDRAGRGAVMETSAQGLADLHRRSETSQAANDRYLRTLASVDDATPLGRLAVRLCRPVQHQGAGCAPSTRMRPRMRDCSRRSAAASSPSTASATATCGRCHSAMPGHRVRRSDGMRLPSRGNWRCCGHTG